MMIRSFEGKAGPAPAGRVAAGRAVPCAGAERGVARGEDPTALPPAWKCGLNLRRPPGPSRLSVCSAGLFDE
jgi:hypothetical protein